MKPAGNGVIYNREIGCVTGLCEETRYSAPLDSKTFANADLRNKFDTSSLKTF